MFSLNSRGATFFQGSFVQIDYYIFKGNFSCCLMLKAQGFNLRKRHLNAPSLSCALPIFMVSTLKLPMKKFYLQTLSQN